MTTKQVLTRALILSLLLNVGMSLFAAYETSYADHLLQRAGVALHGGER